MSSNVRTTELSNSGHSILQLNFGEENKPFLTRLSSEIFIEIFLEFFSNSVNLFSSLGDNFTSIEIGLLLVL